MKKKEFESLSIPVPAKADLRRIAEQEHRSMAQQIEYWIDQHKQKESA